MSNALLDWLSGLGILNGYFTKDAIFVSGSVMIRFKASYKYFRSGVGWAVVVSAAGVVVAAAEVVVSAAEVVVSAAGIVVSTPGIVVSVAGVVVSAAGIVVSVAGVVVAAGGVVVSAAGVVVSAAEIVVSAAGFVVAAGSGIVVSTARIVVFAAGIVVSTARIVVSEAGVVVSAAAVVVSVTGSTAPKTEVPAAAKIVGTNFVVDSTVVEMVSGSFRICTEKVSGPTIDTEVSLKICGFIRIYFVMCSRIICYWILPENPVVFHVSILWMNPY